MEGGAHHPRLSRPTRTRGRSWRFLLLAGGLAGTLGTGAQAATPEQLRAEEQQLTSRQAAAAAAARDLSAREAKAKAREATAAAQASSLAAELAREQQVLAVLIGPLALADHQPPAALLAASVPPTQVQRGLALLGTMSRDTLARAARTAEAAARARGEQATAAAGLPSLASARTRQLQAQADLASALARTRDEQHAAQAQEAAAAAKAQAEAKAAAAAARAKAEAAAKAQAEVAARTRMASLTPPAPARFGGTPVTGIGRLAAPVGGALASGWHRGTDGVTFAAASGATVVAPCGGRVEFADPFRTYGRLVIVDCGSGWRTVLGGLGRLAARTGETVRPGTPLGAMPAGGPQRLYFELRQGAKAVDPTPYLPGHH